MCTNKIAFNFMQTLTKPDVTKPGINTAFKTDRDFSPVIDAQFICSIWIPLCLQDQHEGNTFNVRVDHVFKEDSDVSLLYFYSDILIFTLLSAALQSGDVKQVPSFPDFAFYGHFK